MNSKNKKSEEKTKKILTAVISVLAVIAVAVIIAAIAVSVKPTSTDKKEDSASQSTQQSQQQNVNTEPKAIPENLLEGIDVSGSTDVEVTMTDGQKFIITVLPKVAPISAENFLGLVKSGFYDGLTFHRIIDGFMAQGGDPEGTGMGGSDKTIKGEFASNGYENPLSHQRSVVSMARSQDPDSASSQFFICYDDASFLDGDYAAFGYVKEGMEVVDTFLSAGTDANDKPLKDVRIQTAVLK